MNFNNLLEELKDISTHNVLYHGTDFSHFAIMLRSGSIRGSSFLTKAFEKKDIKELATSRKAGVTKIEAAKSDSEKKKLMYGLSGNIGAVRFQFFADRIRGNRQFRGVIIRPISEIPKAIMNEFREFLTSYNVYVDDKHALRYFNEILKLYRSKKDITYKQLNHLVYDNLNIDIDPNDQGLFIASKRFDKFITDKEFEERFVFKNSMGKIPFDPDLMKIEFLSNIVDEATEYFDDLVQDHFGEDWTSGEVTTLIKNFKKNLASDLLTNIRKYDTVFIKNKNFSDLVVYLDKVKLYKSLTKLEK